MDFFEVVKARRSIRRFTAKPVPPEVIEKALEAALLAPNSSNLQTWEFYWVRSPEKKQKLIAACLNQSTARTAQELIVVVSAPSLWKKHAEVLAARLRETKAPQFVIHYYTRLTPFLYGWSFLAPFKWILFNLLGLFRPMVRRPWSPRDIDEVCIKSAALASQNFMLAITAQGFDTCPMEGFDEWRVKRLLKLKCRSRVVMVISVGERDPQGRLDEQFRFPSRQFIKSV